MSGGNPTCCRRTPWQGWTLDDATGFQVRASISARGALGTTPGRKGQTASECRQADRTDDVLEKPDKVQPTKKFEKEVDKGGFR